MLDHDSSQNHCYFCKKSQQIVRAILTTVGKYVYKMVWRRMFLENARSPSTNNGMVIDVVKVTTLLCQSFLAREQRELETCGPPRFTSLTVSKLSEKSRPSTRCKRPWERTLFSISDHSELMNRSLMYRPVSRKANEILHFVNLLSLGTCGHQGGTTHDFTWVYCRARGPSTKILKNSTSIDVYTAIKYRCGCHSNVGTDIQVRGRRAQRAPR